MSKADEMFEKLGYIKIKTDLETKYRNDIGEIRFWKPAKTIIKQDEDGGYLAIKMKELQAINEKCKEMGWIE